MASSNGNNNDGFNGFNGDEEAVPPPDLSREHSAESGAVSMTPSTNSLHHTLRNLTGGFMNVPGLISDLARDTGAAASQAVGAVAIQATMERVGDMGNLPPRVLALPGLTPACMYDPNSDFFDSWSSVPFCQHETTVVIYEAHRAQLEESITRKEEFHLDCEKYLQGMREHKIKLMASLELLKATMKAKLLFETRAAASTPVMMNGDTAQNAPAPHNAPAPDLAKFLPLLMYMATDAGKRKMQEVFGHGNGDAGAEMDEIERGPVNKRPRLN
jgi:hypothetical protein